MWNLSLPQFFLAFSFFCYSVSTSWLALEVVSTDFLKIMVLFIFYNLFNKYEKRIKIWKNINIYLSI